MNPQQGAFQIECFTLINQHGQAIDISGIVKEFTLHESIYNKFCTATLGVIDGIDFVRNFRLSGQETIRISIKTKIDEKTDMEKKIDKVFRIFKVEKVQREEASAGVTQNYIIKLCDPRLFTIRQRRVSQVFRGPLHAIILYNLIITGQFDEELNDSVEFWDHWEKTIPENKQFISPNWTIGQLIDYCVTRSHAENSTAWRNSMFFYQVLNGSFRFKSIDAMFKDEHEETFALMPMNTSPTDDDYRPENLNRQILFLNRPQVFDTLKGTIGGAYASTLKTYDAVKKLEGQKEYSIETTFGRGRDSHLSGEPMITSGMEGDEVINTVGDAPEPVPEALYTNEGLDWQYDSLVLYGDKMTHSYGDATDVDAYPVFEGSDNRNNAILERKAMLEILNQHRIVIGLPFRTDLSVGQVMKLAIPPAQPYDPSVDATDKIVAGDDGIYRYLITDIALKGEPDVLVGTMHIECVKESFAMKLGDYDPMEEAKKLKTAGTIEVQT